jgi:hypothetical protein
MPDVMNDAMAPCPAGLIAPLAGDRGQNTANP